MCSILCIALVSGCGGGDAGEVFGDGTPAEINADANTGQFETDESVVALGGREASNTSFVAADITVEQPPTKSFVDSRGVTVAVSADSDEETEAIVLSEGIVLGDPVEVALITEGFIEIVYPEGYEGARTVRLGVPEPVAEVLLYWPGKDAFEPVDFETLGDGSLRVRLPDRYRQFVLGALREPIS